MVSKGGVVIGNGFKESAGLKRLSANDEVKGISHALFGTASAGDTFEKAVRSVGKGKVYTGYDINEVFQQEKHCKRCNLAAR